MEDLRDLYQEVILDHNKNPKNFRKVDPSSHSSEGYNPLCGDRINVYLQVKDDKIQDVGFEGSGCAISKAAASVMTTVIKGKSVEEARTLFKKFQKLITGEMDAFEHMAELGKLAVFAGVREFPVRVKCAALAWHTLIAALEKENEVVSTE
ncbi:SUF system NifU family Fe-S cluster assembly protein [candidate division KSB1 bacterium]|nr:SUF system NifU family Fe-S cluster assembly protein [candidate division KSB1 bacterium]NIR69191.1 SUF system NifU family Fe-S cluster assembly protein [candidate division KSB1 bacterium]NIS22667.1 SUF system NifU family Fe-S cluster assembly protein [candidate division KSB1 bacterium]NIT69525.1 SUF system NifU family Fe-S cluster assembly protein [candidate division KSB1 bacterium]NIU23178.1 SUF system NifU family Fe-S cluster assembly protein [candidate division KSB1 bacterium]